MPVPKADEVWWLLKRYGKLIEATIESCYPGRDIGQWYRGEMSSRKVLVLLEEAPQDSQFKKFAKPPFGRGGDWDETTKIFAALHKEAALDRASKYVGGENEYIPEVFLAPSERAEYAQTAELEQQTEEQAMDMLQAAGWL